jgi:hypothetical protein
VRVPAHADSEWIEADGRVGSSDPIGGEEKFMRLLSGNRVGTALVGLLALASVVGAGPKWW